MLVSILDLGLGNVKSVSNMLRYIKVPSKICTFEELERCNPSHIILPGVGSFDAIMSNILPNIGLLEELVFDRKVKFLGICVGFQILFNRSEEGDLDGLGWVNGDVVKLPTPKLPHMGWNYVKSFNLRLLDSIPSPRFYFIHSFAVLPTEFSITAVNCGETIHDGISFISVVEANNIFGVQFHPEKSHKYGMNLFKNFVGI